MGEALRRPTEETHDLCTECCWTPFCPDHRLRQDAGSNCPACGGKGWIPKGGTSDG